MNYANYDDAIVQGRKVKIIGWPASVAFTSPSAIGNLKDMRTLHDGWMTGTTRWVRLVAEEVKEHAEDLERRRDEGEIVGKKCKRRSAKKKVSAPSNDTDGESPVHTNKENNVLEKPTKATKRAK